MVLVPHCRECRTDVLDDDGRPLYVTARLLDSDLRRQLTAQGWQVTPGDPTLNRGPADPIAGDRLTCPACGLAAAAAADAARQRRDASDALPRTKTVDLAARLGAGWTLTQRAGDAARHRWLVEHDGTVHGHVNRYRRKDRTFSSGWEAHRRADLGHLRVDAITSCAKLRNSSFLWSSRDLAAWGIATAPRHTAPRPAWATRTQTTEA
ncbi:hypothetical protein AT728_16280 [Streptomyces silvensis]|uniref:Uncharacterized protein n=2 Tax=Streptomyces silvensis TaxID=1765722 RepID=A0A0W7X3B9_9ACTN|nr:hypothetical protein AT728_16280 [Streptomyces silvensis]